MEQANPWTQVVSLLSHLSSSDDGVFAATFGEVSRSGRMAHAGQRGYRRPTLADRHHIRITVIERQDDASALVSWCDPTLCHYVDQVWTRVTARHCGYCALSGERIQKGDSVFKPRTRGRYRPANCDEMILLASVLEA
jgi:hypothetical protein